MITHTALRVTRLRGEATEPTVSVTRDGFAPARAVVHATRRVLVGLLLATLALLTLPSTATAAPAATSVAQSPPGGQVEILPLRGFLDPPVADAIRDVVEIAERDGAALVVVQLDSAGGVKADVAGLVETVRNATVPVAVLVGPVGEGARAEGAAAVLAAAAPILSVAVDATVGPAAPADLAAATDDLAQQLLASLGQGASAVLDRTVGGEDLLSAQLSDDQVVLTSGDLRALLVELDGRVVRTGAGPVELDLAGDTAVRFHSLGLVRRALHAATTPAFIYLLLVLGLGMLLFEVFQPGFGVAGLAGLVMTGIAVFGLTVLPVAWWALVLVLAGLALFTVDAALAGFGPVTLLATGAFAAGSAWLYDHPRLDLDNWLVGVTTFTVAGFFVVVLTMILRAQAGPDDVAVDHLVGKVGVVRSVLNPEGHVYVDGALWRARWTGEARRARVGMTIRVTGVDGPLVLVEAFEPVTEGA